MKKYLRQIKRFLNQKLGTISDELFWRFRHLIGKNWAESYISESSLNHPHRPLLIQKISGQEPLQSLLEIGCASGPNLFLLAKKYPAAKITGIDISRSALEVGKKWFREKNITNVHFLKAKAYDLKQFPDKSFDIVFSDASLIYLDPSKIKQAVQEMIRLARKTIILNEFHTDQGDYIYDDHWIHNWKELFKSFVPVEKIKLTRLPPELFGTDNWAKYGHIIEVKLSE